VDLEQVFYHPFMALNHAPRGLGQATDRPQAIEGSLAESVECAASPGDLSVLIVDTARGRQASLALDHPQRESQARTAADTGNKLAQLQEPMTDPTLAPNTEAPNGDVPGALADRRDLEGNGSGSPHGEMRERSPLAIPFIRRVASGEDARLRQHLGVAESPSDAAGRSTDSADSAEGVSAFLGRLLNQLSLSAWLPAVMLIGSLAVLLQLRAQHNRHLVQAVTTLVNRPLGLLILLLLAIILATIVTQAFEFEVIRLLEGYWGDSFITKRASRFFVGRQLRKQRHLEEKRDELKLQAFRTTKPKLLERKIISRNKAYIVGLIEDELSNHQNETPTGWRAKRRLREAENFDWEQYAPADLMGRLDAVETQLDEFPDDYRVLPTKLGNVIRAIEDSISLPPEEDLENFVVRRWGETSNALRQQHDQYRTRLDLYCMLVFVFLVLSILSPLLISLGPRNLPSTIGTSLAYLVMSFVSYTAAIASARGYGSAIKAIAEYDRPNKTKYWPWSRSNTTEDAPTRP
jgi:hypothetical protein